MNDDGKASSYEASTIWVRRPVRTIIVARGGRASELILPSLEPHQGAQAH